MFLSAIQTLIKFIEKLIYTFTQKRGSSNEMSRITKHAYKTLFLFFDVIHCYTNALTALFHFCLDAISK